MRKLGIFATAVALTAVAMNVPAQGGVSTQTKPVTAEADGISLRPSLSGNGRLVVFESAAQLVDSDTDSFDDVYLYDRVSDTFERLSVGPGGQAPDDDSGSPVISKDGKRVAFDSDATNLVTGDTNEASDVFVRFLDSDTTRRISVSSSEAQTEIGNDSSSPSISETGKVVAFESYAPNLVAGDTNESGDVFVRSLGSGTTRRVSVKSNGNQANADSYYAAIDPKGLFVAFTSNADNLAANDDNGSSDVFVHHNGKTARVSVNSNGNGANSYSEDPALTSSCRTIDNKSVCNAVIVFTSDATNLVGNDDNSATDVFVRSLGKTKRISIDSDEDEGEVFDASAQPSISSNGRYVAFSSEADLTPGDNDLNGFGDVYLRDRNATTTRLMSTGPNGPGTLTSEEPSISADGRWIAFQSLAPNLDNLGANNLTFDIFLRGPLF